MIIFFFFFNDTATTEIYTLSLHDALPIFPILQRLAQAGSYLPRSLELLLTYPFPKTVTDGIFGDYTGLRVTLDAERTDRKSTRLNSSHANISYAVFCLKKKKKKHIHTIHQ